MKSKIQADQIYRRFSQVDVFTQTPLLGNPVAVVLDSEGISTESMHQFTSWTNLSEATFVNKPNHPEADYSVRIFTPGRELPFAGHPTLGTCHAWLQSGGQPQAKYILQECPAGLIRIKRAEDGSLAFAAPPLIKSGPLNDVELSEVISSLDLDIEGVVGHQWCDNGPGWRALLLDSADHLYSIKPRDPKCALDIGLIAPSTQPDVDFEVRAFFPGNSGVTEDPVTGSLNAALAQWLIQDGLAPERYTVRQGVALGRHGVVTIERADGEIWVGGHSVTVLAGTAVI
jgi:PhzF family phenazine biosynthesis protein